jgi:hypothetical protein
MLPILHNFNCKSFSTLIICHHHHVAQFYHSYSVAVGSTGANKGSGEDGGSQVLYPLPLPLTKTILTWNNPSTTSKWIFNWGG